MTHLTQHIRGLVETRRGTSWGLGRISANAMLAEVVDNHCEALLADADRGRKRQAAVRRYGAKRKRATTQETALRKAVEAWMRDPLCARRRRAMMDCIYNVEAHPYGYRVAAE